MGDNLGPKGLSRGFLLQIEISQIVVHDADEPNAVIDFLMPCLDKNECGCRALFQASVFSYSRLLEPVMRVRLIVEGRDFTISAPAIERLRLLEGSIGLEPQRSQSEVSRQR